MRRMPELERICAPAVAMMIERRLLDAWPLEITKRGRAYLRSAPAQNVWRRALLGDDSGVTVNNAERT